MRKKGLNKRDRQIVKARIEGQSEQEIGEEQGISKQRVCQILQRLEPEIREALQKADYGLDKSLTKLIEMAHAELTEEHFFQKNGKVTDQRIVRKADNGTRLRARELLLRLNVGNLDNRRLEVTGANGGPVESRMIVEHIGHGGTRWEDFEVRPPAKAK